MMYNIFMRVKTGKEITETIIMGIFFAGTITVMSPFFAAAAIPKIIKYAKHTIKKRNNRRDFRNVFSQLKKKGLINISNKNGQIYISLTKEGKKKAGKYQIDNLEIKKPKKWDKKWRILIFDIANNQKIKREALRGKIKELGLFQLQKSVWIYPYPFEDELDFVSEALGARQYLQLLTVAIDNDHALRTKFGIS